MDACISRALPRCTTLKEDDQNSSALLSQDYSFCKKFLEKLWLWHAILLRLRPETLAAPSGHQPDEFWLNFLEHFRKTES